MKLTLASLQILLASFLCVSATSALAETLQMHVPFTTIADAEGNDPTDLNAPLFRRGPGNPLTDKDGNPVTLGQLQEMDGGNYDLRQAGRRNRRDHHRDKPVAQ